MSRGPVINTPLAAAHHSDLRPEISLPEKGPASATFDERQLIGFVAPNRG
jgi:hypothetical protein